MDENIIGTWSERNRAGDEKMCNDYRLRVGTGTIADDFSNIKIKLLSKFYTFQKAA